MGLAHTNLYRCMARPPLVNLGVHTSLGGIWQQRKTETRRQHQKRLGRNLTRPVRTWVRDVREILRVQVDLERITGDDLDHRVRRSLHLHLLLPGVEHVKREERLLFRVRRATATSGATVRYSFDDDCSLIGSRMTRHEPPALVSGRSDYSRA